MKVKAFVKILSLVLTLSMTFGFGACSASFDPAKNITVVAREAGSGTRSAFDEAVTDGTHKLVEKDSSGNPLYRTTAKASFLGQTGLVLSAVQSDKQAIGYISLGSVNDTVKTVKVDGVLPSAQTVLNGSYKIQRPFVIMTNNQVTLTALAQDFLNYLYSGEMQQHCDNEGTIFLTDPTMRANSGKSPVAVSTFSKVSALPEGKIVIRGSSSMDKLIHKIAAAYADIYDVEPTKIFDIQLEGSSYGRKAAQNDAVGNVIGLSSAAENNEKLNCLNLCLDAVAVIVNKDNNVVDDLTLKQLYLIYSGEITKFNEI